MKNQLEEGFLDKLFGMIAQGKADRVAKKMMKDDPKFAKAVKTARQAHKDMEDSLRARGLIK
jgi:hypothetical protein|tara:strand:- start:1268 stop:1453 length:186 start_codon:yes stop_codon:yes gene_type:complete